MFLTLRRNLAVYILNDSAIKEEILRINYNDSETNYFARTRIKKAIRKKYF